MAQSYTIIKTKQGNDETGHFRLEYPVLQTNFTNKSIRNKVNRWIYNELVTEQLCEKSTTPNNPSGSQSKVSIVYESDSLLSFKVSYERFCKGLAHPNDGEQFIVIDLKTGNPINFEQQLEDVDPFNKNIKQLFLNKNTNPECQLIYETLTENDLQFLVVGKNVTLRSDFIYAVKVCELELSVDCGFIKPYLKQNSWLRRYCEKIENEER